MLFDRRYANYRFSESGIEYFSSIENLSLVELDELRAKTECELQQESIDYVYRQMSRRTHFEVLKKLPAPNNESHKDIIRYATRACYGARARHKKLCRWLLKKLKVAGLETLEANLKHNLSIMPKQRNYRLTYVEEFASYLYDIRRMVEGI